ncbi:MAG: substrate-binding domain-containing protein [Bacteroidetes bacterium]|jgi:phosphate transport system substrate-binding protein|nr:substrate-binding domain-containing protein [Bacteroidota bacterium]
MKNRIIVLALMLSALFTFQACKQNKPGKDTDTQDSGEALFVSDESFAPILDQELYIFKNDYPKAKPTMAYRSENGVVKMLIADSARFGFLARDLSPDEREAIKARNLSAQVKKFAVDAVAIIVNVASPDTGITVSEIKKMLVGQAKTDRSIVFDNPNSSLVRFLKEFTGQADFRQKNIYALKSNKEVIEYVSKHPEAIGITGFSWIDDPDADYADAAKKVRVLAVRDESNEKAPAAYFRPSQETLYLKQYPLLRYLYIVNCTGRTGLGHGFEYFIESDKGQRIILRSGLLPINIPERNITIHSNKL